MRERFDELLAEALREMPRIAAHPPADVAETARALNLLNTSYLLDAFGREPRVSHRDRRADPDRDLGRDDPPQRTPPTATKGRT